MDKTKLKKWKLLKKEDVSPSRWLKVFKHRVRLPKGDIIDDYFVTKLGDVSMIVALTDKKEIAFVNQYKHGVRDIILELPAGRIGKLTPEKAAKEELEEETGFVADRPEYLGGIYGEPSKDSLTIHGFLARKIVDVKNQKLDITEDIEVVLIPAKDVDGKIKSGVIRASDTIAIIRLAQLKAPELFK
jgi:8-oxo-dGTP pyrophosphatase MutT (NUDIX family)